MAGKRVRADSGFGGRFNKKPRKMLAMQRTPLMKQLSRIAEQKFVDKQTTGFITSTGTVTLINGIGTGTDQFNRIGKSVYLKTVTLTSTLLNANTGTSEPAHFIRLLLVRDNAPNGAATPVLADFLREIDNAGGATTTALSMQNTNNRKRFTFLIDKLITIPPWNLGNTNPGNSATAPLDMNFKRVLKINKRMQFSGTGTAIADIQTNAMYWVRVTDLARVPGTEPYVHVLQSRFDFVDM